MKKILLLILLVAVGLSAVACSDAVESGSRIDANSTMATAGTLQQNQPTPTDLEYSLERYNLIRRAYWVNGQREKAMSLPCEIADVPLGYVVLFTEGGGVVGRFCVQGKVSSLNSFLTPDSEYYERSGGDYSSYNRWIADVDGSYGENDSGIFFFTPDGKYIEWNGCYLYSDIPFEVDNPVVSYPASNLNGGISNGNTFEGKALGMRFVSGFSGFAFSSASRHSSGVCGMEKHGGLRRAES